QIVTAVMTDGEDAWFAGLFADPNGSPNRGKNFARWNPNLDFTGYEAGLNAPPAQDPTVPQRPEDDKHWFYDYGGPSTDSFALERLGNYLYIAGGFLETAGDSNLKNLARFNLTTLKWEAVPGIDARHRNFVRSLHADEEGYLWVGGDFASIGGVLANKVARFDPATDTWSALSDPTAGADALGPISGGVYGLVRSGDYVYIGGFLFNHDDPSMRFIRRFDLNSNRWEAVGDGLNDRVSTLAIGAFGEVYAGGAFTASGNQAAFGLAVWDGSKWSEVGGGVNGIVRDMAVTPQGKVVIGGQFDQVGSQLANNVAAWNGGTWDVMDGGIIGGGSVNGVFGLSINALGHIYIGGDFDLADSDLSRLNKTAVWDGTGKWKPLGSGLGNSSSQIVTTVLAIGQDVYMGGVFADPLGAPNRKKNFARWNPTIEFFTEPTVDPVERFPIEIIPAEGQYQIQFQALIGSTYRLEISDDLVTWSPAGNEIVGDGGFWYWAANPGPGKRYFRVVKE
ncbi:MAG: hypothetical protein AAF514_04190, partial [Verrucomicrobiota bacterium]